MTKLRVVVLLTMVALLLLPAVAFAQEPPDRPCRFYGVVQVDGADVADGTTITATVDGDTFSTDTPEEAYGSSSYGLKMVPAEGTSYADGATITFKIGADTAEQTATWESGANTRLDLSIGEAAPNGGSGTQGPAGPAGAAGPAGSAGPQGEDGEDAAGGIALPIIALVIAIIAIGVAAMSIRRKV
jgi:hypothetical protein